MHRWFDNHILNIVVGILTGSLAALWDYFYPISGSISVVACAIIFDMCIGISVSRKKKQGIKSHKLWRTVKKLFYALSVLMLLHAGDTEIGIIDLYPVVAFFIFGFEMWSILEKIAFLVDNRMFMYLRDLMRDRIKDNTGIDVSDEKYNKD